MPDVEDLVRTPLDKRRRSEPNDRRGSAARRDEKPIEPRRPALYAVVETLHSPEPVYGTEYPRPSHILTELARVVRPCGRFGILHFTIPSPPPGCRLVRVYGVTQGCGYRIRALTVFERAQDDLPGLGDSGNQTRSSMDVPRETNAEGAA